MITRHVSGCYVSCDYWIIGISEEDLAHTNLAAALDLLYFLYDGLALVFMLKATFTKIFSRIEGNEKKLKVSISV